MIRSIQNFLFKTGEDGSLGELNFYGKIVQVTFLFIIIRLIRRGLLNLVDTTFKNSKKVYENIDKNIDKDMDDTSIDNNRAFTIVNVIKKIISATLYFIWIIIALETFGISTSTIIATAGIGGVAIGFGAQSLVKDVITGFFILFENQFSVGDHVELEGYSGIVEDLGLRVTKIRSFSGELYIIPNGYITIVTNMTRGPMRADVVVSIAYEEDIDNALEVLENMCEEIGDFDGDLLEKPKVIGVSELGNQSVDITIHARCKPTKQFSIAREIRKIAKETLVKNNIEIPYPRNIMMKWEER